MRQLLALIRRAAQLPGLRRLTEVGPLLRLSFALRAGLVRERLLFAVRELAGRRTGTYVYTRPEGVAFAIRHRTADVMVLDEIFAQKEYEPPSAALSVFEALPDDARVVDLGANIGLFGVWIRERLPNARITAFEPDPTNAAVHLRTIEVNGRGATWALWQAAATNRDGSRQFDPGSFSTSQLSENGALEVRAIDVLPILANADLVKIDVEGGEWSILGDARFVSASARLLVVEYHPQFCPGEDPRSVCAGLLAKAGYTALEGGRDLSHGTGLLWGVREATTATEG